MRTDPEFIRRTSFLLVNMVLVSQTGAVSPWTFPVALAVECERLERKPSLPCDLVQDEPLLYFPDCSMGSDPELPQLPRGGKE